MRRRIPHNQNGRTLSNITIALTPDEEIIAKRQRLKYLAEKTFDKMEEVYQELKKKHDVVKHIDEDGNSRSELNNVLRLNPYYSLLKRQFDTVNKLTIKHINKYHDFYTRQRLGRTFIAETYIDNLFIKYSSRHLGEKHALQSA